MATKNSNSDMPAADIETPLENHVVVPHQSKSKGDADKAEVIVDEAINESFVEKVKKTLTNKKVIAGVGSVALITAFAARVFVVSKRNADSVMEDEVENN